MTTPNTEYLEIDGSNLHLFVAVTKNWVNIGPGNGLLPDGTNFDLSSGKSKDNHLRAISQAIPQPSITKISLKIAHDKFDSNPPGASD